MATLTILVDDEVLRRTRIRALKEGLTVNAVLRDYLSRYADGRDRAGRDRAALRRLIEHAQAHPGASGGHRPRRADLYEGRASSPR